MLEDNNTDATPVTIDVYRLYKHHFDSNNLSSRMCKLLIDHMIVESNTKYLLSCCFTLINKNECTDETISCIHRLASRIDNEQLRIRVMSEELKAHPVKSIRNVLSMYGGKLDENDRNYIIHAAGCGKYEIVKQTLQNGCEYKLSYELTEYD